MIQLSSLDLKSYASSDEPLALFIFEEGAISGARFLTPMLRRQIWEGGKAEGFKAKGGECANFTLISQGKSRRCVLIGLGKKRDFTAESSRRAGGSFFHYAKNRWGAVAIATPADAQAAAEGLLLASYQFVEYKKIEPPKFSTAYFIATTAGEKAATQKALDKARIFCESVALTRNLVNRGPSDKTPQSLGELAKSLSGRGVKVTVWGRAKAEELGMGSFLSVARGSTSELAFVHLSYKPAGSAKKRVGLVGKGITFDSGGLSLKPAVSMETMKSDMAGAAAVLAVFKALPQLHLKAEVHGFCAFTYNLPGPEATKPGDVVKAMNGKTIEILNTDAEGRLILADALVYACKQNLDAIIDLATLTGAAITALGSKVTAVMGNNKALLNQLFNASKKSNELIWELPLVRDYRDYIRSDIADLRNIGKPRGEAGTIIGGLFLQEFIDDTPWVHCDIAGTDWSDGSFSYGQSGGTGVMVRTLLEYLLSL